MRKSHEGAARMSPSFGQASQRNCIGRALLYRIAHLPEAETLAQTCSSTAQVWFWRQCKDRFASRRLLVSGRFKPVIAVLLRHCRDSRPDVSLLGVWER